MPSNFAPADPAKYWLGGYTASRDAAVENQRLRIAQDTLDQRASMQRMQLEVDQKQMEQNFLRQQQQLEMTKAFKEAEHGLQRARLQESQRMNDQKINMAARRFQARQQYAQDVGGGADPVKAALSHAADLEIPGGGVASLANSMARRARPPATVEETMLGKDRFAKITEPSGNVRLQRIPEAKEARPKSNDVNLRWQYNQLRSDANQIRKTLALGEPPKSTERRAVYDQNKADLSKLEAQMEKIKKELLPDKGGSSGASGGKVKVKNPDGKVGYIPESQLEKALDAGYTRLDAE